MVAQYEEELEGIKVTSIKDAEIAQATFMTVIRKLAKSGEIALIDVETPEDESEESAADPEAAEA
jgi:flagellar motor switch protein FliG